MDYETLDKKYIVFKREDWKEFWNHWQGEMRKASAGMVMDLGVTKLDDSAIDDAVVIRTQDVFSGPALACYANGICVAVDILKKTNVPFGLVREHHDIVIAELLEIADYFHQQSEVAFHRTDQKLPDR